MKVSYHPTKKDRIEEFEAVRQNKSLVDARVASFFEGAWGVNGMKMKIIILW